MSCIKVLAVLCLFSLTFAYGPRYEPQKCSELNFLPMPKKVECSLDNNEERKFEDPCSILFTIKGDKAKNDYKHFIELIEHQQYRTFGCHIAHTIIGDENNFKLVGFKYIVNIEVKDPTLKSALTTA